MSENGVVRIGSFTASSTAVPPLNQSIPIQNTFDNRVALLLYWDDLFCHQAQLERHGDGGFCPSQSPTSVASFPPNAIGLDDMHGNVREWCLDSLEPYPAGAVVDPFVTGGPARVTRGGDWNSLERDCRSGARDSAAPLVARDTIGVRVVLGPIRNP